MNKNELLRIVNYEKMEDVIEKLIEELRLFLLPDPGNGNDMMNEREMGERSSSNPSMTNEELLEEPVVVILDGIDDEKSNFDTQFVAVLNLILSRISSIFIILTSHINCDFLANFNHRFCLFIIFFLLF